MQYDTQVYYRHGHEEVYGVGLVGFKSGVELRDEPLPPQAEPEYLPSHGVTLGNRAGQLM